MILAAFLLVSMCVVVPFLYYYARRNPHPRFRPKLGEMILVSMFAVGLACGGSLFMATILGVNPDFEKMGEAGKPSMKPQRARTPSRDNGLPDFGGDNSSDSGEGITWPWDRE
jgi:hypothetical protein